MQMVGLREPVTNRLDARFTDADGDLVADTPTDASRLVDPKTIIFSYIPDNDPEAQKKQWEPFVEHLEKITAKPVEFVAMDDSLRRAVLNRDDAAALARIYASQPSFRPMRDAAVDVIKAGQTDEAEVRRVLGSDGGGESITSR